ncbi:Scr1 family TA system antitoxin-like transcriptional regulator [Streptomyces sp. PT12]|uniref:Scr1 family TA system antitoxin-like transcriptional regulator n=1 Tax=Streptomyces sp. PT12 TaxID=1510197 RepID=UPI001C67F82B|nr:Scr1 family TA system antitoxin-like transcriptional regulator [Streptomyces sp. PT12]
MGEVVVLGVGHGLPRGRVGRDEAAEDAPDARLARAARAGAGSAGWPGPRRGGTPAAWRTARPRVRRAGCSARRSVGPGTASPAPCGWPGHRRPDRACSAGWCAGEPTAWRGSWAAPALARAACGPTTRPAGPGPRTARRGRRARCCRLERSTPPRRWTFTLLQFTDSSPVVWADGSTGGSLHQSARVVAGASAAYDRSRAHALSPDDSLDLINIVLKEQR